MPVKTRRLEAARGILECWQREDRGYGLFYGGRAGERRAGARGRGGRKVRG
jgi:hypothetical protein